MRESVDTKNNLSPGFMDGPSGLPIEAADAGRVHSRRTRAEVQNCAERAALGAGLPFAKAARFGAALVMHLWAGRDENEVSEALSEPERLTTLADHVEQMVEEASLGRKRIVLRQKPLPLLLSFVESTPCAVRVIRVDDGLEVSLHLGQAAEFTRPDNVEVSDTLWSRMTELAAQAGDAGQPGGAGLMGLE